MSCFECCSWCRGRSVLSEETEPLMKKRDSQDRLRGKFQLFRKTVLENSLKDFGAAREDIRDVTLLLPPTGVGSVDAQLSGYVTLYNDHLERWKNLRKLVDDLKTSPVTTKMGHGATFRSSLTSLHKIIDEMTTENVDVRVDRVSEFCLLIDYRPSDPAEDKSERNFAIVIFNQINRDLREFLERGPSLARLLKSISGGVRFGEITIENLDGGATSRPPDEKRQGGSSRSSDPPTEETAGDEIVRQVAEAERNGSAEREDLDSSISRAGLSKDRKMEAIRRYSSNLELLGRGATIVEVLDLAARTLWQNIHDELSTEDQ